MSRLLFTNCFGHRILILSSLLIFSNLSLALDVKTFIPDRAFEYRDTIKEELDIVFPELSEYNFVPALIEHESCISLKHSRCWSPTSQLKTSREQGLGFFQLTRAWRKDGSLRFDTIKNLKRSYKEELRELSWDNARARSDLQIRAGLLLIKQNYKALYGVKNEEARLHMTDAAHNSGVGNTQKERRACGLANNCNPGLWIDNVENHCQRSKRALYAGRSACDITKHHVRDVFFTRLPKYKDKYIVYEEEEDIIDTEELGTGEELIAGNYEEVEEETIGNIEDMENYGNPSSTKKKTL